MARFRRRDSGALLDGEQVEQTEVVQVPFFRDLYTSAGEPVLDPYGMRVRYQDGMVEVTIEVGEWKVSDGLHTWPMLDADFRRFAIAAEDHEFVPYTLLDMDHYLHLNRENEEAIRNGERYAEAHGDNQRADDVQQHNLGFYRENGMDERADFLEGLSRR